MVDIHDDRASALAPPDRVDRHKEVEFERWLAQRHDYDQAMHDLDLNQGEADGPPPAPSIPTPAQATEETGDRPTTTQSEPVRPVYNPRQELYPPPRSNSPPDQPRPYDRWHQEQRRLAAKEASPQTPAGPPSPLAALVGSYTPPPRGLRTNKGMTANDIKCWTAIGVLTILEGESADRTGGYPFTSADVWQINSELQRAFDTANTVGTYVGDGLVVGANVVEPGLRLLRLNGHSPYWHAPVAEAAQAAIFALLESDWPFSLVEEAIGKSEDEIQAALRRLWTYRAYRDKYPGVRRRPGSKPGKKRR